jgi:hypothetical protein
MARYPIQEPIQKHLMQDVVFIIDFIENYGFKV